MNLSAYLFRIGYTGPIDPTPETLRLVHRAHLETVPFENLDIGLGRRIAIGTEAFVRKVVSQRRGGFCYELNGAFAALLQAMGFRVTLLSARIPRMDGSEGPEFDHLTLGVDLDQPWLADVGFGDGFLEPLLLKPGIAQKQDQATFRITENYDLQRRQPDGTWRTDYRFSLTPRSIEDFADMCHFHQTSPDSHFTQKRVCTLATPGGRITLSGTKLIVTSNGIRHERMLTSEAEWAQTLLERFRISLT